MQKKGYKIDLGIVQDLLSEIKTLQNLHTGYDSTVDSYIEKYQAIGKKWAEAYKVFQNIESQAKELGAVLPPSTAAFGPRILDFIKGANDSIALLKQN
jgi:hypothetical protein